MNKSIKKFGLNYWENNPSVTSGLCKECDVLVEEMNEKHKHEITMELTVHCIDSQPGDKTRYSYFVYRGGYEYFHFMPKNSCFQFPQRLKYWDCKDFDVKPENFYSGNYKMPEELIEMAEKHNCNVWTLIECIRTMKELKEGDL